jgi:small subunit ribosomal protein S21
MIVFVHENRLDQANRTLKRKMQRAGIYECLRLRKHFEKPSEKNARIKIEMRKKIKKSLSLRLKKEGF